MNMFGYELTDIKPFLDGDRIVVKVWKRKGIDLKSQDLKCIKSGDVKYDYFPNLHLDELKLYQKDKANLDFLKVRIMQFNKLYGGVPIEHIIITHKNPNLTVQKYVDALPNDLCIRIGTVCDDIETEVLDVIERL